MNKLKITHLLFVILVSTTLFTNNAFAAIDTKTRKFFGQNNIIFVDYLDDPGTPGTGSDNTVAFDFGGVSFYVVNTKLSPAEYTNKACSKYGICQKNPEHVYADGWNKKCDAFARTNAADIYYGTYTTTLPNYQNGKVTVNKSFSDPSPAGLQAALSFIYDQILSGKPVVLAANLCRRKYSESECSSSRHFITIVGVRQGVNANTITETDLLYIDPWGSTLAHTGQNNSRKMRFDTSNHSWYMYTLK